MDSCLNCGEKLSSDAKFCAACGTQRGTTVRREGPLSPAPGREISSLRVGVIVGAFVLGGAVTAALLGAWRTPVAAPHLAKPSRAQAPNSRIAGLPPGHPQVRLPPGHPGIPNMSQVSAVVIEAGKQAERSPTDIAAWNRYGDLAMRFAMFDPANYKKARAAFIHVLALDPGNSDALHGIGDVYYDTREYSKAIDVFNRYLRKHPNDDRVRTDLGTMYLSRHNSAAAVKQYQIALMHQANFFPAQFNLAVAYLLLNENARARDAFSRARAIAPDGAARTRIDEMIAKIDGNTDQHGTKGSSDPGWSASGAKTLRQ
jgi:Flp pilus assembly protein TadD